MKSSETLPAITHKIEIGNLDFYLHLTERDDKLELIHITGPRVNADYNHFTTGIAELINLCLEEGIELSKVTRRLMYIRGETAGATNIEGVRFASSIIDLIAKILANRYLKELK